MRRALTKEQVSMIGATHGQAAKKTLRQQKKERAFPMKKFALKA